MKEYFLNAHHLKTPELQERSIESLRDIYMRCRGQPFKPSDLRAFKQCVTHLGHAWLQNSLRVMVEGGYNLEEEDSWRVLCNAICLKDDWKVVLENIPQVLSDQILRLGRDAYKAVMGGHSEDSESK